MSNPVLRFFVPARTWAMSSDAHVELLWRLKNEFLTWSESREHHGEPGFLYQIEVQNSQGIALARSIFLDVLHLAGERLGIELDAQPPNGVNCNGNPLQRRSKG